MRADERRNDFNSTRLDPDQYPDNVPLRRNYSDAPCHELPTIIVTRNTVQCGFYTTFLHSHARALLFKQDPLTILPNPRDRSITTRLMRFANKCTPLPLFIFHALSVLLSNCITIQPFCFSILPGVFLFSSVLFDCLHSIHCIVYYSLSACLVLCYLVLWPQE